MHQARLHGWKPNAAKVYTRDLFKRDWVSHIVWLRRSSAPTRRPPSQSRRSARRPLPSCVYPLSRPRRSFLSGPHRVANRGNDIVGPIAGGRRAHARSRKNFVLRPETFRRSNPQLRGYQTQVTRNGRYGSAVRAGTETADKAIRKPRNDLYPRREIISGAT